MPGVCVSTDIARRPLVLSLSPLTDSGTVAGMYLVLSALFILS